MSKFFLSAVALFIILTLPACASTPAPDPVATRPPSEKPPQPTPTSPPPGLCDPPLASLPDAPLVIGYQPNYRPVDVRIGSCLTDIMYFSIEPLLDGGLDTSYFDQEKLDLLKLMRERYGVRLHLSLGGYGRSTHFGAMVSRFDARENFVGALAYFLTQHEFDGVDFDWEFPETQVEYDGYVTLLNELSEKIKPEGILLSITFYPYDDLNLLPFQEFDRLQIMSYDRGPQHATFDQAVADVELFLSQGVAPEKIILGLPFYGRVTQPPFDFYTYAEIVDQFKPTDDQEEVQGIFFNGVQTVQRKTCFAVQNGLGGIMIWELGQDTSQHTLLRAIHQAALGSCPE